MSDSAFRAADIRLHKGHEDEDVALFDLLLENNLLHALNEDLVASPEQLAFMVAKDPDQIYLPCSDEIFRELRKKELSPRLRREYGRAWRLAMGLLASLSPGESTKRRVRAFCRRRFQRALFFHDILPSRLVKRLSSMVIPSADREDPWLAAKQARRALQEKDLASENLRAALDSLPALPDVRGLNALESSLGRVVFARLCCLAAHTGDWTGCLPQGEALARAFAEAEEKMAPVWEKNPVLAGGRGTILLLCDAEGGAVWDLALARFLMSRGHRVVYAVKQGFYFNAPTLEETVLDPALRKALAGGHVCREKALSKNALLKLLREWRLLVIGDGTRERLNLLRVSVTFSRAWKEADLILARGWRLWDTLLGTSHRFTRDVLCWKAGPEGFAVEVKPRAEGLRRLSEDDINGFADELIAGMRQAHAEGRPVVFYSCIIGSIPGQTKTALRLATAIVNDIRERLPGAFVLNPAQHFVEGMDGDDLMYMWERVQRSGFISLWFFQTAEDIERGFRLLGEPVPEVWIGKDATYSTGCTKEMRIALDVQKTSPELQILGPDPAAFTRRSEYGVGKYFDAGLVRG